MKKEIPFLVVFLALFSFAFIGNNAEAKQEEENQGYYNANYREGIYIAPPVGSYYGYYPPQSARIYVNSGINYNNDGYYTSQPSRTYTDYRRNDDRDGYYPPQPARIYVNSGINDNNYDNHYPPSPPPTFVNDGRNRNRNDNYQRSPGENNGSRGYNRY